MPHNFARDRYAPCRTGSGSLNRAPPGIRSIARLARSVPVPRHTWPCRRSQTFSSGHQLPFTENRWGKRVVLAGMATVRHAARVAARFAQAR